MLEIQFQSRSLIRPTLSADCRYYCYHSLTQLCAGKQLQEFKDISTEHITKLDIPALRKLLLPHFVGFFHFPLTSNTQTVLARYIHMAATREPG